MKENPIALEEHLREVRPRQLVHALKQVEIAKDLLQKSGGQYVIEKADDTGEVTRDVLDNNVLAGMRGGTFGLYREMVGQGQKDEADKIIEIFRSPNALEES